MRNIYKHFMALILTVTVTATGFGQDYSEGIFILNEGNYGVDNASVSFIAPDGTLENDIFSTANPGEVLGNTAQGLGFYGDLVYIVVNGSNHIKVVNRADFTLVATIGSGLDNPRYIEFYNGKGYVTNWGDALNSEDDYVAVINLETNEIESTIPVVEGPEKLLKYNDYLYVAHYGGWGYGNTVSVIDLSTHTVTSSIEVGDVPTGLIESNGFLYVLSNGKAAWTGDETIGGIYKIDLSSNTITTTYELPLGEHPSNLALNDELVYYILNNGIYSIDLAATTPAPALVVQTTEPSPYGINIIEDEIYLADAVDYTSDGRIWVYNLSGELQETYTVGVTPNGIYQYAGELAVTDNQFVQDITIYPNPAIGSFSINTTEKADVRVYDMAGRLAKKVNYEGQSVDISNLPKGIYVIEIITSNHKTTKKLIVK